MKPKKNHKKIVFKKEKEIPHVSISSGSMLFNKTGTWRNEYPEINLKKCTQCSRCWAFCPDLAIYIENEWPVVDLDYCKGCGICAEECKTKPKCIEMVRVEK